MAELKLNDFKFLDIPEFKNHAIALVGLNVYLLLHKKTGKVRVYKVEANKPVPVVNLYSPSRCNTSTFKITTLYRKAAGLPIRAWRRGYKKAQKWNKASLTGCPVLDAAYEKVKRGDFGDVKG